MTLKLNLGSGKYNLGDYINIDAVKQTEDTVVGNILNLDYKDSTVDVISSSHVIEHLTTPELDRFFYECHRMLKIGGQLEIIAPCMATVISKYCKGEVNIKYLHDFLFALHEHEYDFHKQGIYKEKLELLCAKYKFKIVKLTTQDRAMSKYELILKVVKE